MRVLLVGSGGREHAIAWKVAQSPRLAKLWIAPGNAGTGQLSAFSGQHSAISDQQVIKNVPIRAEDSRGVVAFARENAVDLVIVGPEGPLAAGLADDLREAGVRVFGPSRAAAQIETSKSFAKAFMVRHGIPTARYAAFTEYWEAAAYLREWGTGQGLPVIKASGLAAGKGVLVPETLAGAEAGLRAMMVDQELGDAAREIIIEERLAGEEVSLLAFTDGATVKAMPPAQDHKRLLDGDRGPNTGGMGAYAPAPICPPALADEIVRTVLQPAVDGLRAEGMPFVGVLYAGMMLTTSTSLSAGPEGPKVLEFNCRFGDPETQVILPLLETDLLDIVEACVDGRLDQVDIHWKSGAAVCVVLASEGYPVKPVVGRPLTGDLGGRQNVIVFHAGTKMQDGQVVTSGGRVLGVTGMGSTLRDALDAAYEGVGKVEFEGRQYRKDIGNRLLARISG